MMTNKAVKFPVTIEIEANVDVATNEEAIEFMLERLAGMTITSIESTEERNWDCTLSNIKLENGLKRKMDKNPHYGFRDAQAISNMLRSQKEVE